MRYLIILSFVVGCGRPPDCTTAAGVSVYGSKSCDTLDTYEALLVNAYASQFQISADSVRHLLATYSVEVKKADHYGKYYSADGTGVTGECDAKGRMVYVGLDDWAKSALAHEFVHAVDAEFFKNEGCTSEEMEWTKANGSTSDPKDHCTWRRRAVWKLINTVHTDPTWYN
jgi:hypothetical protein